jgi:hypothetical protein
MERKIALALNKFPSVPLALRTMRDEKIPLTEITVDLASLYHHYYLDSHGIELPDPDPAQFEHLQFLMPCPDFRFRSSGIGISTAFRRNKSTELGQAFCRWFLHDYLGVTFFAHMQTVLGKSAPYGFGVEVTRTKPGDTPDYLCAGAGGEVYLAEAKGRYSSVSFKSAEFRTWRAQFERVQVKDAAGHSKQVKGFIIAVRFGTEESANIDTTLFAEDPNSLGDGELNRESHFLLRSLVVSSHYASHARKLNQPILATALENYFVVPEEIRFPVMIWEFQVPPLRGTRFVGGYYPKGGRIPYRVVSGKIEYEPFDELRLDLGRGTFFGIEEDLFRKLIAVARRGTFLASEIYPNDLTPPIYSAISVLRDGSILAPVEFLAPVGSAVF